MLLDSSHFKLTSDISCLDAETYQELRWFQECDKWLCSWALQLKRESVQGERTQQVATHARVRCVDGAHG